MLSEPKFHVGDNVVFTNEDGEDHFGVVTYVSKLTALITVRSTYDGFEYTVSERDADFAD